MLDGGGSNIFNTRGLAMLNREARFQIRKEQIRKRLLKYTRKAFRILPQMDKPRILDIGCGSGVPTMELARLSGGEVIGIDIDQPALDKLIKKIKEAGFSDRVQAINCSILDMSFPDESFDIIWSEGSIFVIGFKRELQEWKRFLKPNGFMVIHDEEGSITQKLEQITECDYDLLSHFTLTEDIWWAEYYAPLEKSIQKTRIRPGDDLEVIEELQNAEREIDMFKKHPERNRSVYFVIKKN